MVLAAFADNIDKVGAVREAVKINEVGTIVVSENRDDVGFGIVEGKVRSKGEGVKAINDGVEIVEEILEVDSNIVGKGSEDHALRRKRVLKHVKEGVDGNGKEGAREGTALLDATVKVEPWINISIKENVSVEVNIELPDSMDIVRRKPH